MSQRLFDDSDDDHGDDGNELKLGTNEDYAKSYNSFRKKELLKKYKDRGYDVNESDLSNDSESSSSEDEVDPKFDEEFFKTLASLKSKDPAIYDKNTRFFDNLNGASDDDADGNGDSNKKAKVKKSKPVTIKDYERQIILEKNGKFEDDTDEDAENAEVSQRSASPTVVEEERRLKAEFTNVMNADDSDGEEEEFGGIFKKREKSKEEKAQDEADFAKWLAGEEKADIQKEHKEKLAPLKNYWNSQNLPQSERFLRDYILNQGYADVNAADIPTYDEIVGDNMPLSEDEQELEKQAEFEHKYNFRFEEPDSEFIQRYPRTIEHSVRRTDDKRKQKRQELKERKQQEKEQKMKEFEMIKEMKRKEIEEKIRKLKAVTGNDELGFKDEELEDDFDPEAHDRRMQEIFNDDYYEVDEGEDKPECPSDIDELKIEDWDNYDPQNANYANGDDDYEPHCEDDDFNMDCDYDPAAAKQELQKELIDNTKGRRGRRGRRNRFMEMIQTEKPAFDPEDEKTYGDYIDEYYQMDCEDVIGDIPCRFKYVETTPNDFGLTIEEILLAKNKELNQWASLKKAIQIRPQQVEKKEQRLYMMKAKNEDLKRKIFKSIYGDVSDDEDEDAEKNANAGTESSAVAAKPSESDATPTAKKAKKKKKRKAQAAQASTSGNTNNALVQQQTEQNSGEKIEEVPAAKKAKIDDIKTEDATSSTVATPQNKNNKKNKKKTPQTGDTANIPATTTTNHTNDAQKSKGNGPNPFSKQRGNPSKSNTQKVQLNGKTSTPAAAGAGGNAKNHKNPFNKVQPAKPIAQTANSPMEKSDAADVSKTSLNASNPFNRTPQAIVMEKETPRKRSFGVSGRKPGGGRKPSFGGRPGKFKTNFKPKFNGKPSHKRGTPTSTTKGGDGAISDDRLKAYGINPRKFHKKEKYGK